MTNNSQFAHPKSCGGFPLDPSFCGGLASDAFVAEVTADRSIGFVTYDGGGFGSGIAVDSSGIHVTGQARFSPTRTSTTFLSITITANSFVQRLSLTGQGIYFTFAGGPGEGFGSGEDFGNGIALDDLHNAWAVGATNRTSGTVPPGDVLIVKVAPDGTKLVQRLFSSTSSEDAAMGVAVADRKPWVTGKTCGDGFPTTDGIVHRLNHCAVFVLQLDEVGNRIMGIVFGGADGDDAGIGIVTNGGNDAFVTGYVNSTKFLTTAGALIPSDLRDNNMLLAGTQGFVAEMSPVVSSSSVGRIIRSGLLMGSTGTVIPYAIANDNRGGVYVAGATTATFFPAAVADTPPGPPVARGFATKLKFDLTQFDYSVILGEALSGVALRGPSPVFAPEATCRQCLPEVYVAGWQQGNRRDAFMVKMIEDAPTSFVTSTAPHVPTPSFTVSWAGSASTSNISSYDIFVSGNGGPFTPFQTATLATSATFTGMPGHTYGFFSVATDAAGNKEPMKTAADVVVTIGPAPPTIYCTGCYFLKDGSRATLASKVGRLELAAHLRSISEMQRRLCSSQAQ